MRNSTQKKHLAVYEYFNQLFEIKRKRYDDSIKETADRFFYSVSTVEDILRKYRKLAV